MLGKQLNGNGVSVVIATTQVPTANLRHGGRVVQLLVIIVQTLLLEPPTTNFRIMVKETNEVSRE